MILAKKTPHVVLDFTMTGVGSETIKSFTAALGLPTISGSFGQVGDLRQWRSLNSNQTKFLLQVIPPADILPEAVRAIVTKQDITNAAIIFDEYFGTCYNKIVLSHQTIMTCFAVNRKIGDVCIVNVFKSILLIVTVYLLSLYSFK